MRANSDYGCRLTYPKSYNTFSRISGEKSKYFKFENLDLNADLLYKTNLIIQYNKLHNKFERLVLETNSNLFNLKFYGKFYGR